MMNWEQARELLLQNIIVNQHLDPQSNHRFVLQTPNNQIDFFKISIGFGTSIKVTLVMLENTYNATISNQRIYNKAVIYGLYPREVNNHSCYVHVVGQLFVTAGLMLNNCRNYQII